MVNEARLGQRTTILHYGSLASYNLVKLHICLLSDKWSMWRKPHDAINQCVNRGFQQANDSYVIRFGVFCWTSQRPQVCLEMLILLQTIYTNSYSLCVRLVHHPERCKVMGRWNRKAASKM